MQKSKSSSASIVARAFALQAGVAMWLCLFGFLLHFYVSLDEQNLMPGITGQKEFDIARFVISASAAGLLVESIVIGRHSESSSNLKVWYISLLFLLPYFHHFIPRGLVIGYLGSGLMLYACLMSEVRLWMVDSSLAGRFFYIALGLPTFFIVIDTIADGFMPSVSWYWMGLELPLIYTSCILTAISFTVLSSTHRQIRLAFTSSLVVLNAVVWYFGIVKPY